MHPIVARPTGGLEITFVFLGIASDVARPTGGLETLSTCYPVGQLVARPTGGLENQDQQSSLL